MLCTGFIDFWREKPEDYDARLKRIYERGLDFICANPDLVVEVDGALSYCAGAIAERYQRLGGKVIQAGKPYAPIYDRALARAAAARGAIDRSRVLAIGDAMRTDISGAAAQGFDSLFVTSGIHRDELHARRHRIRAPAPASTPPPCVNSSKRPASLPRPPSRSLSGRRKLGRRESLTGESARGRFAALRRSGANGPPLKNA